MAEINENIVMAIIIAIFVVILIATAFIGITLFVNTFLSGTILIVIGYSVYRFMEFRKIQAYESQFPNFLRDLAQTQHAGLSLLQAFKAVAKSDYGLLSDEIRKINNQLSWNIPLEKVLENFRKRMRKSRLITHSVIVIEQANKSGAKIEDILDSLATNIEDITSVQKERKLLMGQQVTFMYAIFFIFLAISIALIKFLIPMLEVSAVSGAQAGLTLIGQTNANPCSVCINNKDITCSGCAAFFYISSVFGFGDPSMPASYYKALFFTMVMIQGFFSGLIAGQIGSDSVIAGVKHSLIMDVAGLIIFLTVSGIGFI